MDYAAKHDNLDGDEEVNETLQRASYSEHKNGTSVRAATDGAEMPTFAEGGSEGGTPKIIEVLQTFASEGGEIQRIIDILQTAAVESPGSEQSSNRTYDYGRLHELLHLYSRPLSIELVKLIGGSTVVVDEDSTRLNQDLENGGVPDESTGGGSTGGGVAVQTSSGDYHQYNGNEFDCRICHMITATDVVINLGCRCRFDLGRAHGVCAETWFRLKGNRQCEICGQIAKNVQISDAMDNNAPSRQETSILNNAQWIPGGLFASESDDSEDAQNGLAPTVANNGHLPTNGSTLATTGVLNFSYRKGIVIFVIAGITGSISTLIVYLMVTR